MFDWTQGHGRFPQVLFKRAFVPLQRPPLHAGIVTAYTDGQVTLRANRDKVGYHEAVDTSTYRGVEPGDFVVHGLDILRGSVGVSDSRGVISPVCTVCLALSHVEPRFIAYAMRAQAWAGVPRALARGVREGGADFRRWDTLGELPVPMPPLHEQRRIADFLDDQSALLDRAVALRLQQVNLLHERFEVSVDEALWQPEPVTLVRLAHLLTLVTSGPRGWGDFVSPQGVPFFRSANLSRGSLAPRLDNLVRVSPPVWAEAERTRAGVRLGDVLLGITGANAGWVAYVSDPRLAGAVVSQHVALTRPNRRLLSGEWLAHVLGSRRIANQLRMMEYGGTKTQLSLPNVRDLRVPRLGLCQQEEMAVSLSAEAAELERFVQAAGRQLNLLHERKQALITAAVTGQFDVTTARSAA